MNSTPEQPSLDSFSERLEYSMMRANMNQTQLADAIGTTSQTIRAMRKRPSFEYSGQYLAPLARALQVSKAWLGVNEGAPPEGAFKHEEAPGVRADHTRPHLSLEGLNALQVAGLEALATLMRIKAYSDSEVIDLLSALKPRLEKAGRSS